MKRFIKTLTVSRVAMFIVKHDADARKFLVLQWDAEDEQPKLLRAFVYVAGAAATPNDVIFSEAQRDAIQFATEQYRAKNYEVMAAGRKQSA